MKKVYSKLRKKENVFIRGTVLLVGSGAAVKVLSAAYRVIATRAVGAVGMGQYSAVFSVFMPFFALATAGITPTVSRLCALKQGDIPGAHRVKKSACLHFGLASLMLSAGALIFAYFYGYHTDNPYIFPGVALLCPNMIFAAQEAVYKGVGQGGMRMESSAAAGIIESSAKILILLALLYIAKGETGDILCLFASVTLAGRVCLLYMSADYRKNFGHITQKVRPVPGKSFSMALPISMSALVVTLVNFFDTVVCLPIIKAISPEKLMAAYPFVSFTSRQDKTMWLYGVYHGLCLSVVNIIPSFSAAVGSSTLPLITRSVSKNRDSTPRLAAKLLKLTSAAIIPASLFVAFFPSDIIAMMYGNRGSQTALGGYFLGIMAPVAVFSAFSFPLNSILHSYGRSASVFKILLFSSIVKMAASVCLCSVDSINIMGLMYSQMIFHITVFVLSVLRVKKEDKRIKVVPSMIIPFMLSYILLTAIRGVLLPYMPQMPFIKLCILGVIFFVSYFSCLLMTDFLS